MPSGFRVTGAEQLKVLAAELKVADPNLLRLMRRDLRAVVTPIAAEARDEASKFSTTIPPAIAVRTSFRGRTVGVWIAALASRLPEGHKPLARLQEFGSRRNRNEIRHPSRQGPGFGQTGPIVSQPTHPFLIRTAKRHALDVRYAMKRVMDTVAREAGFR